MSQPIKKMEKLSETGYANADKLCIITIDEQRSIVKLNQNFLKFFDLGEGIHIPVSIFKVPGLKPLFPDIEKCFQTGQNIRGEISVTQQRCTIRLKYNFFTIFSNGKNIVATFENVGSQAPKEAAEDDMTSWRELESFLFKSAHNLKGPASSISALTRIAIREVTDPTALQYLKMINQSSERLEVVISDLMNMNRIKQGNVEFATVDLAELAAAAVENLKYLDGFKEMSIQTNFGHNRLVVSDAKHLYSIFQNLIENAIKYKKPCKPGLLVIASVDVDDGISISFSDNGVGIPEEARERIFEMFYRATEMKSGSGLGLYIVKTALKKIGGSIKVESKIGLGSTFSLFLPGTN